MSSLEDQTSNQGDASTLSRESILIQLSKILSSQSLSAAPILQRFLEFTVLETLSENLSSLKEFAVAIEVFKRSSDYDPNVDSTVRSAASRLRKKLKGYYASEGRCDPIIVEYPLGRYIPTFKKSPSTNKPPADSAREAHNFSLGPLTIEVDNKNETGLLTENGQSARQHVVTYSEISPGGSHLASKGLFHSSRAFRVTVLTTLAVLLTLGILYRTTVQKERVTKVSVTPPPRYSDREVSPTFSPDGEQIAFHSSRGTQPNNNIYRRLRDQGQSVRLTNGPDDDRNPVWSPDGKLIAFIRNSGPRGAIYLITLSARTAESSLTPKTGRWLGFQLADTSHSWTELQMRNSTP